MGVLRNPQVHTFPPTCSHAFRQCSGLDVLYSPQHLASRALVLLVVDQVKLHEHLHLYKAGFPTPMH